MNLSAHPELWWQGPSALAESPLWSALEQAFYWVDISARRLWRHDGTAAAAQSWEMPNPPGCIALGSQAGELLVALSDGVQLLSLLPQGRWTGRRVADAPYGADMRFNDGRCDRQGRFWVGSMALNPDESPARGRLARLQLEGEHASWQPALREQMLIPNGLAFSPDGARLYFSDSHRSQARVWVCDYDPATGQAAAPQPFIDRLACGRPDGAAVDADGGYWICANDGAAVLRYTPAGVLDRRIDLPVAKPTMCAFGGPDLGTLLITTMCPAGPGLSATPLDGALFALRPGVTGLAETPFAGGRQPFSHDD
ncbi:SMP-30/gluconolactonase/LRE family protein [Roseateles sp.]|jgi:sugar lactone lactonase YvrE|uniref:SMP-30/gluconolactonase/LRE family protein n=1 Tax=Roseateles sp. TaxID=1971397 RepID=UPI0037CBC912